LRLVVKEYTQALDKDEDFRIELAKQLRQLYAPEEERVD